MLKAKSANSSVEHAADNHRKNGVVPMRVVLKSLQTGLLKQQIKSRISQCEQQGFHTVAFGNAKIGKHAQRNIDDEGNIADAETGNILDHGGDAVDSRWREIIFNDEKIVAGCLQQGHGENDNARVGGGFWLHSNSFFFKI